MSVADKLTETEIERYGRHIILPEIGGQGQQKLKAARVCMVGAGGLGSPVLMYLAAAGVGILGIVDDDQVSLSNLQRQIIHATSDIKTDKTTSAANTISLLNPHVQTMLHPVRLNRENAASILGDYDLVIDGSDNFATRYLIADTAEALKIPLVAGALGRFDGSLTVLAPYDNENQNPRYRDLFPAPPTDGTVPSCAEAGIMGAVAGVIGTLQAVEAIKLITGVGRPLIGEILLYDGLEVRFEKMRYKRRA
ncbi:MAG: molybdopterin-synthase adenylyltransferase MoeB [Ahrensia sp.]|nr:molybdopterin-synthase adenylyltransferase MoeB [Ahrensia sp.]